MQVYEAPLRDMKFVLHELHTDDGFGNLEALAEFTPDLVDAVLEEAAKVAQEVLLPLNRSGDIEGCTLENGVVRTPKGFKEAYDMFREGGWCALASDPEWGGQGLPEALNKLTEEMICSSNLSFSLYPGLTHGATTAIEGYASDALKQAYLPKMVEGTWSGTMCLTEPHCGTDLGMLRTKAVPQGDDSYKISGAKIFISAGEHDLTENIIHLVLARLPDAPEGVKGISLFLVPKYLPKEDGTPGPSNGVSVAAIEHKMGLKASATCQLNFDDSVGWLVGTANKGMEAMFKMMNTERVSVGIQGLGVGEAAYQSAVWYAKERVQGRSLSGVKNPKGPADPIIVHPDVRRMLLEARAFVEGGQAFILWTALHADLEKSEDEAVATKAKDYMGLLTPVLKAYLTDKGFHVASLAMQVHGGSGYTEHFPASQYLRDARITMIYEGANGIQALDLVGRKLPANGGRAIMSWFGEIDAFVAENESNEAIKPFVDGLADAKAKLQDGAMWLMQNGMANPDNAAAASTDYLNVFGLTALAYMWALMAKSAQAQIEAGSTDPYYATKLQTGRYFVERILPDADAHLKKMKTGADVLMAMPAEAF